MQLYNETDEAQVGAPTETTFTNFEEFEEYKSTVITVIEQAKAAARLAENKDFQTLIMNAYLLEEPRRLGALMASGRLTEQAFQDCVSDLRGAGNLLTFLRDFTRKGAIAEEELKDLEEARNAAIEEMEQA